MKEEVRQKLLKRNSRTTNTIFNFTTNVGGQLVSIALSFVVRTVFIMTLGKSYLGIGGLFSNILTMLSLAEFGVGSAIVFKLYEPMAAMDEHRIAVLMKFYKKMYRIIGLAVAAIGLCLIPFLPKLINGYDKLEALHINAAAIFLLYLLKSVSSYFFFAYKSSIIRVDQKGYLLNVISYFFSFGLAAVQIVTLLLFKNFMLYVVLQVAEVITQNIFCARLADAMYPCIKNEPEESLSREEVRGIFKDCYAIFLYTLNNVVLKATDYIIISMCLGIDMVGIYSNYYIFYTSVGSLFKKIYTAVSHSLGNLHTERRISHEYKIYKTVNLITAVIGYTAGIGIAAIGNEFVTTWIGSEWVLAQPFAILLGIETASKAFRIAIGKYRSTMGLFRQAMYRPVVGMAINLVLSVLLVRNWGISGVLVGTIVADLTTMMWYDPYVIHKYGFAGKYPVSGYYLKFVIYAGIAAAVGAFNVFVSARFFTGHGWFSIIVHGVIVVVTVPAAYLLAFWRTEEGKTFRKMIFRYVKKLKGARGKIKKARASRKGAAGNTDINKLDNDN